MTLRTRMAAKRQAAYCSTALNPRVQSVQLILGDPESVVDAHVPITERQQSAARDGRTTVTSTRREASAVVSRAEAPDMTEIQPGFYGKLIDEEGTEWRMVGVSFKDDAYFRVKLVVSNITGAGSIRAMGR